MDYHIRDEDLLQKLEDARGKTLFATVARHLEHVQKERDEAKVQAEARAAELAALPRDARRRAIIREVIESDGPGPENLRFMPTPLAICGLPYRRLPATQDEFIREQGKMRVVVSPGKVTDPNGKRILQPIPWGPKARLIMAHLSTEALRNNSPTIETASSFTAFMRDLGFERRGGVRGNIRPFKEQLQSLAACRMEIAAWNGKTSATVDVKPFSKMQLWFSDNPDQQSLWPNTVQFSEDFYKALQKHALPVDVRALRAFSNSARKLDLLFWITYRITRLESKLILDWKPLKDQFGEGFSRERDFKAQLADDLASVLELFPKLPIKLTDRGLEMENADAKALAIPRRTTT
ncbi:MAG: hypothetical protein CMJ42_16260 [Phyllobacteriaceae bacterium]|nr:hypothetical protein [Phyllobacteriaceae bacterium]